MKPTPDGEEGCWDQHMVTGSLVEGEEPEDFCSENYRSCKHFRVYSTLIRHSDTTVNTKGVQYN